MTLTIPSTLKLTQLKHLAFQCGILTSGTKPILIRRLQDEINQGQNESNGNVSSEAGKKTGERVRILSIDMGIRNLAYCMLDVPARSLNRSGSPVEKEKSTKRALPSIQDWHRVAVSSPPAAVPLTGDSVEGSIAKEAFDPATLSRAAYTLLRTRLLPGKPTHILIERQRFRSMGSRHILEWTVRVNMFESIIYAVLWTLKAEGLWEGNVRSVLPGKVGPFWVSEDGKENVELGGIEGDWKANGWKKVRKSINAKIRNKGAKIDLVRSWLESGDVVELGNEGVKEMAKRYVDKWDRLPGGRKIIRGVDGAQERMGKLDDLADCLLQGMAWIEWEENKRVVMRYGVEALLDS